MRTAVTLSGAVAHLSPSNGSAQPRAPQRCSPTRARRLQRGLARVATTLRCCAHQDELHADCLERRLDLALVYIELLRSATPEPADANHGVVPSCRKSTLPNETLKLPIRSPATGKPQPFDFDRQSLAASIDCDKVEGIPCAECFNHTPSFARRPTLGATPSATLEV